VTARGVVVAVRLLRADAPGRVMGAPEDWPRWAVLLPHVLAAAGHADRPGQQQSPAVAADVAWLLERAGIYLQIHARFTDARPLQERALAIDETTYGPDHPNLIIRLNTLALILEDLGEPQEARTVQERAKAFDDS
jgi:hypothetical protein